MIPLSKIVRMQKGTIQTYLLSPGDESYFLKKLATYTSRCKAKIDHDMWVAVRLRDDSVQRMVVVKVVKPGKALLKRGRKRNG